MTTQFINLPEERASDHNGWLAPMHVAQDAFVRIARSSKATVSATQHTLLCYAFMNTGDTSG